MICEEESFCDRIVLVNLKDQRPVDCLSKAIEEHVWAYRFIVPTLVIFGVGGEEIYRIDEKKIPQMKRIRRARIRQIQVMGPMVFCRMTLAGSHFPIMFCRRSKTGISLV